MGDSYQAVYDAVRSRMSNGDVGAAVQEVAWQTLDISHAKAMLQQEIASVGYEMRRPSVLFRPNIFPEGTMWCALLGENLMEGICGFGETPEQACAEFDKAFWSGRTPAANVAERSKQEPR